MSDARSPDGDHFSPQAGAYAAFRPTYPAPFIARIAALAPRHDLVWDVGAGSGQASVPLAAHFARVHATDVSERQVQHARSHARVHYRCTPAERSELPAASADLVTVAQALHWFAGDPFYEEVDRVLCPGGVLAAWSYDLLTVDPAVDAAIHWFYADRLGPWWPPERRHVETRYRELPFPYPDLPLEPASIDAHLTRDDVIGYVSTWSALRHAREGARGGDPLADFASALRDAWPGDERRLVRWPLIVRAGRKGSSAPLAAGRQGERHPDR